MIPPEKGIVLPRRPEPFPFDAVEQSARLRWTERHTRGRKEVPGITFGDGEHGFWLEKRGDTHFLTVSFADVASLIGQNTPLDQEAYKRGFTRKKEDVNEYLFPSDVNYKFIRIGEERQRPTFSVTVPLDDGLNAGIPHFERTLLVKPPTIDARKAEKILGDASADEHIFLTHYYNFARDLLRLRQERGALAFFDPERGLATTPDGKIIEIPKGNAGASFLIQQEFLLVAEEAAAEALLLDGYPFLCNTLKPKPYTPDHASLKTDIANAIEHPDIFDRELYERRRTVLFDRQKYSAYLEEHYGLRIRAHIDLAMPGSNFASLVGQRILEAYAADEEPPYSIQELQAIAERLNTIAANPDTNGTTVTRVPAKEPAPWENGERGGGFRGMSPTNFERLVEAATRRSEGIPEVVQTEILRRLDEEPQLLQDLRLTDKSLFYLLITAPKFSEENIPIRTSLLELLIKYPGKMNTMFNIGVSNLGWAKKEGRLVIQGPPHEKTFSQQTTVIIGEKTYTSETVHATTRDRASSFSLFDAMTTVLELPTPSYDDPQQGDLVAGGEVTISVVPPREYTVREDPLRNYYMELTPLVRGGKTTPQLRLTPHGPKHNPYFTGTLTVRINGSVLTSAVVTGRTEGDAKQSAAEDILRKITALELQRAETKRVARASGKPIIVDGTNYKGGVNSLAQREKWPKPKYSYTTDDSGQAVCTITVALADNPITITAHGGTNDEARDNASMMLLEAHAPAGYTIRPKNE